jgi:hypothetical protein
MMDGAIEYSSGKSVMDGYRALLKRTGGGVKAPIVHLPKPPVIHSNQRDWLIVATPSFLKIETILLATSVVTGFWVKDLKGLRRTKKLVDARHVFFWIAAEKTTASLTQIGRMCGGRHHSTVMSGLDRIARERPKHQELIAKVEAELFVSPHIPNHIPEGIAL